jgi:hypothetical protein
VRVDDGVSDGGFDVVALGTGLRLSRHVRAGFTVNRWLTGYGQRLERNLYNLPTNRPRRDFDLDFRPSGWSFNFGLIVSPIDTLNVAAVYKTPFTANVSLNRSRRDYFAVLATPPSDDDGNPAQPPPPIFFSERQYPTLEALPDPDDPTDPALLVAQQDAEQIRAGVEWVLIKGRLKIPLRAGYFNDRQITAAPGGEAVRFNGVTAGTGLILGALQLDLAWVYEFGEYFVAAETSAEAQQQRAPIRYALTTNRVYASIIYRFSGRWLP